MFVPLCVFYRESGLTLALVYEWYGVYDINTSRETHSCRGPCPLRSEPELAGETFCRVASL